LGAATIAPASFDVVFDWSELPIFSAMKPLLANRKPVVNPVVSVETAKTHLEGLFWLVMPETGRDVQFLQLLGDHQRFSPWEGEGIVITDNVIPKY
jgi:hypothetical protein